METFEIRNLSFSYPEQSVKAIDNVSLTIKEGEFVVICGHSGCGKSTLLRNLKSALKPHGITEGKVFFEGRELENIGQKEQAQKIGFVQQSPENQIVTDKVWHELAFGLESLGYDNGYIRRKVAEIASFFGMEDWFYKNVSELSGGQKQLLNLASVMAMNPSALILDESASQLDPIAASEFIFVLGKINRELGTTVVITEHRLEEVIPLSHKVVVMEKGSIVSCGSIKEVGRELKEKQHKMFLALPAAMKIWASVESSEECPVTIQEGRDWLKKYSENHTVRQIKFDEKKSFLEEAVLKTDEVWFRYEKNSRDVVKSLTIEVKKGELYAVVGSNGAGKTTTLKLLSGILKPYRGEIYSKGKVSLLPQNPQTLFVKKTVWEDLYEVLWSKKMTDDEKKNRLFNVISICNLNSILHKHPYDISGGEQQRAALAKVLLTEPDVLLLDEPTKGFDAEFKITFAQILEKLLADGKTIVMVSHDVEFCAKHAHKCGMFFDGNIVSQAEPHLFFSENSFYTTSANRIARDLVPMAVTAEEVIEACGGKQSETETVITSDLDDIKIPNKEKYTLSLWRKALAFLSGAMLLVMFFTLMTNTELSSVINANGFAENSLQQIKIHIKFLILIVVFLFSVSKKGDRKENKTALPSKKEKISKRTLVSIFLILLAIPFTLYIGIHYFNGRRYYTVAVLILLEVMMPFFMIFENRKPKAREMVILASLCALGVVGRAAFFMLPQFKPIMAIVIISGVAFGAESGFLVGAMTMLISNMMFSQGPWLPWQMFAMGFTGFLAGILFKNGILKESKIMLCIFGFVAAVLIYGGIMNPAAALMSSHSIDKKVLLTYYITGLPIDCIQGAATSLFLYFGAEMILEKLERVKIKYGLIE